MLEFSNESEWKMALEKDAKLRQLAVAAGIENNFKRARELNGCIAWDCGEGVIKNEAEMELAMYMFCTITKEEIKTSIQERCIAAKSAGVDI